MPEAILGFHELLLVTIGKLHGKVVGIQYLLNKFSLTLFFIIRTICYGKFKEGSMPRDYRRLHVVELKVEG